MTEDISLVLKTARDSFRYDPDTGTLVWDKDVSNVKAGSVAGWKGKQYRYVGLAGCDYPVHRIIWLMVYGRWPNDRVDHVNGNALDNRLCNLREATATQNLANARTRSDNLLGVKGVRLAKNNKAPYRATLKKGGVTFHLGYFRTAEAAHAAYVEAATRMFGKFARVA